jgi:hypothetical protein
MAPFILGSDQSYVEGKELRLELNQLAESRKSDSDVFPPEDSLIGKLWLKHWKRAPAPDRKLTEDEIRRITEEARPFLEALREQPASEPSKSNFPKPFNRM